MLLEAGSARTHQVHVGSSPSRPLGLERHQWMRPQGLWALGPSAGSVGQVSMTPGEPGGGGGLVRLPCAEKPGTPPCAGLPRGPRLLGPCPSPAPGPGHPALQPGSAQVKGETQADGHSCPAAAGPAVGRRFTCCPVPVGPTGRTGRGTSPVLRPPTGVGGAGAAPCCPQGSPETTRPPVRDAGQDGASSAVRGFSVAPPSRPPPPHPLRALR